MTFAVVGWNLGCFILKELKLGEILAGQVSTDAIMIPAVSICLAAGIVLTEIFLSSPTRPLQSLKLAANSIYLASGLGLVVGITAGLLSYVVGLPGTRELFQYGDDFVRSTAWFLVALTVSISEGLAWGLRAMEAKNINRLRIRIAVSLIASFASSWIANTIFESLRRNGVLQGLGDYEDLLRFILLGICLGIAFGFSTSPGYMTALRAGFGFEHDGSSTTRGEIRKNLEFVVSYATDNRIEEGLSIQLPNWGKVIIGSDPSAQIYLEGVAPILATLDLQTRETWLYTDQKNFDKVHIEGYPVKDERKRLKHNTILTFYRNADTNQFYRFVYYNRFLDPIA
jgi:hypothetical protein